MKLSNEQLAYALARITMGAAMFGHGLVRMPKLAGFRDWMVKLYDGVMPAQLVGAFATILPFIELLIGLLLIVGLFTRSALVAGAILMIVLILGSCMKENWEVVGSQMIYGLFYYFLIRNLALNAIAIDWRKASDY